MGNGILNQRGQSTLEAAVIMVIMILLLAGITNMWFWANNQIVKRQLRYNATRVTAGTAADDYKEQWPVYQPKELNEKDLLRD